MQRLLTVTDVLWQHDGLIYFLDCLPV